MEHTFRLMCWIALSAVTCQAVAAGAIDHDHASLNGRHTLKVMTWNLYQGASLQDVLALDPTDSQYPQKLITEVTKVYRTIVEANDFRLRAKGVADQIANTLPDLVALQEASLVRKQSPGDAAAMGKKPATKVVLDYVGILQKELRRRRLPYQVAASIDNYDVEVPMMPNPPQIDDVRLTDRDVILVRSDFPLEHQRFSQESACQHFKNNLSIAMSGLTIFRSWCALNVRVRRHSVRFVSTHLEEGGEIQALQAQELLDGPAKSTLPVVMVGDFNSDANGQDGNKAYGIFMDAGFVDAWNTHHFNDPGLTWGHDALLADPSVPFVQRLDLVLTKGPSVRPAARMRVLDPPLERNAPPLWSSDHAGVFAKLRLHD